MCYYVGGVGLIKDLMLYIIIPTVLTTAAGYMINDHLDQGRDEVNQKKSRKINFGKGLYFYYVLFNLIALILTFMDGIELFLVVLGIQIMLWAYSKFLSSIALIGNAVVAILSCFTILIFYFSQTIVLQIDNIWVALVAIFLVSMARELIKDNQDFEGDKADGAQTLPIMTSKNFTHIFADVFIFCNALFIAAWTFYDFYLNDVVATVYGMSIAVIGIVIIIMGHVLNKTKRYGMMSNALKVYMFLGMIILFYL